MTTTRQPESLASLLGGRGGAIDATMPPVAFGAGWLLGGQSIWIGAAAALVVSVLIGGWRLRQGAKPRAVLVGALAVCVSALVALYTGRASDFFLIQIFTNAASALGWTVSIVVRWPFLGLIVGAVLGQKTKWRRDPALLRAYSRASWVWVAQYLIRLAVFVPLWAANQVVALTTARVALTWPLVAACLAVSWWVLRRSLPADHPGLRLEKDHDEPVQP
ncbi:DUF3159 domain-containing protein [Longispora sp. NPDC051575]|uniref:DUF3159 domain-containing protein n=1 Tax=Longispora sp. NPDC051575 TaxID=3154943 RepID=UPI00343A9DAF